MTVPGQISQLLAEIIAAEDEAAVVDLLLRDANVLGDLPPRERERAQRTNCRRRSRTTLSKQRLKREASPR
jgi:hypothetical protein